MRSILAALFVLCAGYAHTSQIVYGHVLLNTGAGVPGITIQAQDTYGNYPSFATSDANGLYSILVTNLFTGTVKPFTNQIPMYPASYSISALSSSYLANFTASVASVSGVLYTTNGLPFAGVPVDITASDGSSSFIEITAANGVYGSYLTNGWTGTVTPAPMFGLKFSPTNLVLSGLSSNRTQDFCLGGEFVGGLITNITTGLGVDGLTVAFVGTSSYNVITTNGGWFGQLLPMGWTGSITPAASNGYFTPVSFATTNLVEVNRNVNYSYSVLYPKISGRVTSMIAPQTGIANVPMISSDGTTVFADAYGYYAYNVTAGFSGTLTPTAPPQVFHPTYRGYTNVTKNMSGQDFVWVPYGMTYVDPMGFLTNRLPTPPSLYTLARADMVSVIPKGLIYATSTNLQTDVQLLDAALSTVVSNVVFQRAYTSNLDPSAMWHTNLTSLWGGFIVDKNLWATFDATFTNVVVSGNLHAYSMETGVLSNNVSVSVYGYVDSAARDLGTGLYRTVAPAYTTTVAGVYSMDFAVARAAGSSESYASGLFLTAQRSSVQWVLSSTPYASVLSSNSLASLPELQVTSSNEGDLTNGTPFYLATSSPFTTYTTAETYPWTWSSQYGGYLADPLHHGSSNSGTNFPQTCTNTLHTPNWIVQLSYIPARVIPLYTNVFPTMSATLPGQSIRDTIYLDSGTVVTPYLYVVGGVATSTVSSVGAIRLRAPMQTVTDNLWE